MSKELLPHIFDLFVQSERTLERAQGGLGIGLSLVKGVIDLHDGEIHTTSRGLGLGSEFIFKLKRLVSPLVISQQTVSSFEGKTPGMSRSVTIVDDNADAAETLTMYLRETGSFIVTQHLNPYHALESAKETPSDIYILDIGMPDMDGFELAGKLRSNPRSQNATIIALSGYGLHNDKRKARDAGFNYHFTKPVDFAELRAVLVESSDQSTDHRQSIS